MSKRLIVEGEYENPEEAFAAAEDEGEYFFESPEVVLLEKTGNHYKMEVKEWGQD